MSQPTLILADDHKIVLDGLQSLLAGEFRLVAIVTDGRALVEAALRLKPDAIVADISMPELNGIDAVRQLRLRGCEAKVVFLTMHPDRIYLARAMEVGASGYVLKHAASEELVIALQAALRGERHVSPQLRVEPAGPLTARQLDVLRLLAGGKSAKEIGGILDISPRTVETHKYKMMDDLGLKSTAELIQYALRHNLLNP